MGKAFGADIEHLPSDRRLLQQIDPFDITNRPRSISHTRTTPSNQVVLVQAPAENGTLGSICGAGLAANVEWIRLS
jgi:hypothetical protein